ncbi:MAG: serine/threonine-protein kinase [Pirellulaceae bacterium]|nr:serine/threonine-protein kinase [Pirellulaceae bacterium]
MSDKHAERNLLVGFLALQLDFIRREQFLAAMSAWLSDKSRPLADVLQAQGALTASVRPLLDALVVQHLALHANDPEKSLAALSSAGSVREEIAKFGDDDVNCSVALVGKDREPTDPYSTVVVGQSTSEGARFRRGPRFDGGGIGILYKAEDSEIHREVVVKELKENFADDPLYRTRLRLEAEITGGLEHPGIVPVYGLGANSNGRPFYAMKLIRGGNLQEAINKFHAPLKDLPTDLAHLDRGERLHEFKKLMGRFIDVCNAVAYAHSRGVLHRDLKPGNIMLGKYGETLVVDWGLAKPLDVGELPTTVGTEGLLSPANSGSASTLQGSAIGTPSYMSPEQAAGRIDQLGPASDVFSLGATLYSLLTGQPPQTSNNRDEVLRRVERGEFPRPHEIKRDIPPALEAVCLKAMSPVPADRYSSVTLLAADLERWRDDEPVHAYPESFVERGRRWARKHQAVVATAGGGLLATVLLLSVLVGVVVSAKSKIEAANLNLLLANKRETAAKEAALKSARIADDQTKKYHALLQRVVYVVQYDLVKVPGAEDIRRSLLERSLQDLEMIGADYSKRSEVTRDIAVAQSQLAEIFLQVGDEDGLNGVSRAVPLAEASHRNFQALAAAEPDSLDRQLDLSGSWEKLGDLRSRQGNLDAALLANEESLKLATRAATKHRTFAAQRAVGQAHLKIGNVQMAQSEFKAALASYQSGLATFEKLLVDDQSPTSEQDLATALNKVGDAKRKLNDTAGAFADYERALQIRLKLAERTSDDAQQRSVAIGYSSLSTTLRDAGDLAAASKYQQMAMEIIRALADKAPNEPQRQRDLSVMYNKLGKILMLSLKFPDAMQAHQNELAITKTLATADPADADAQRDLFQTYQSLATVAEFDAKFGNTAEAGKLLEAAISNYQLAIQVIEKFHQDSKQTPFEEDLAKLRESLTKAETAKREVQLPNEG